MSMSGATAQNLTVTLPNRNTVSFLDGSAVSLPWWRWFQVITNIGNAIPDTGAIAQLQAEIATLTTQVAAAQATAEAAQAEAAQALSQADNTLGYVALSRLDGTNS